MKNAFKNFAAIATASVDQLKAVAAEFGHNFKKEPTKEALVKLVAGNLRIELPADWKAQIVADAPAVDAPKADAPTEPKAAGSNLIKGKFRRIKDSTVVEVKSLTVGAYFKTKGGAQVYKLIADEQVEIKDKDGKVTGTARVIRTQKVDFKPTSAGVASETYDLTRENGYNGYHLSVKSDQNYPVLPLELVEGK